MGVQWKLTVSSCVELESGDVEVDEEALYIKGCKYKHNIKMTRTLVQDIADMKLDDNQLCKREVDARYWDHDPIKPKIKLETNVGSVIVSVEDLLAAINKVLYGDH
jgi:Cdc6-like AAA superfamily ATPase